MAQTVKDFAISTLRNGHIQQINFRFDQCRVYPQGYHQDIASRIESGRILITCDPGEYFTNPVNVSDYRASYRVNTARGEQHKMFFSPDYAQLIGSEWRLKKNVSSFEMRNLRGSIVHESTHALQDYQRTNIDPRTAEGAAYLAGAIYKRLLGMSVPNEENWMSQGRSTWRSSHVACMCLARLYLERPLHGRINIPMEDVALLKRLVRTGSENQYQFNGI